MGERVEVVDQAAVRPLDRSLVPLLVPEVAVHLALGAGTRSDGEETTVSFEGDAVRIHREDFLLAKRVSERLLKKMGGIRSAGQCVRATILAQQYVSEELFRPGAVRVLFYATMSKASAFYRCLMPSYALGQGSRCASHVASGKFTRAAFEYDVVVFQIDHSPGARQFAKALKEAGKKIVYEFDDAFDCLEPWHPSYATFGLPERRESIKEMMHLADAVQVSTSWLADRYRKECKRIEVIPNVLELSSWPPAPRLRSDGLFKIVWAGSQSHSGDLRVVLPVLSSFAASTPNVRVVMFGQEMKDTGIPSEKLEVLPWCEFEDYPFKLAEIDADISVAPLADIPFNYGKSNLRILQMWATGYPVIASAVGPYAETIQHGSDGIVCRTEEDWTTALKALYESKDLREFLSSRGTESMKRWDVHPNISKIESFYTSLVE